MATLHVVGGGLAGMTVAWEVSRSRQNGAKRYDVVLYERSNRLGGKAGSDTVAEILDEHGTPIPDPQTRPRAWSDHGYHLFPEWYHNVIEIMGQIGILYDDVVVEGEQFSTAEALTGATLHEERAEGSLDGIKRGLAKTPWLEFSGTEPANGSASPYLRREHRRGSMWAVAVTALDLVARRDETLAPLSVDDFLRRKHPYLRRAARPVYESLLLKALSAELHEMSALAVAKMFRRWASPVRQLWSPSWSSLDGSLQNRFIGPFGQALRHAGVDIKCNTGLVGVDFAKDAVVKLHFEGGREVHPCVEVDPRSDFVVLAVPPDVLQRVTSRCPALQAQAARLARMASKFAGIDVYFSERQATPRHHFGFPDEVWTTAYDITPVWKPDELVDPDSRTVLQLVVPQASEESDGELIERVKGELNPYFGFDDTKWIVHRNEESPLSLANVGVHQIREDLPQVRNLLIAGDFMKSSIGVPSMEGAVGNGRRVAAKLLGSVERTTTPWRKALRFGRHNRYPDPDERIALWVRAVAVPLRLVLGIAQLPVTVGRLVTAPFRRGSQDAPDTQEDEVAAANEQELEGSSRGCDCPES